MVVREQKQQMCLPQNVNRLTGPSASAISASRQRDEQSPGPYERPYDRPSREGAVDTRGAYCVLASASPPRDAIASCLAPKNFNMPGARRASCAMMLYLIVRPTRIETRSAALLISVSLAKKTRGCTMMGIAATGTMAGPP